MTINADRRVEQAIDALRRGHPLVIDGHLALLAIDLISDDSLARFEAIGGGQRADLLITGRRAAILRIDNRAAASGAAVVRVRREAWHDIPALLAIADPVDDLAMPFKGPFRPLPLAGVDAAALAAIQLLKRANLLPAAMIVTGDTLPAEWAGVASMEVRAYLDSRAVQLRIIAQARVPLQQAEATKIIAFRADDGALEHLALLVGDPPPHLPVLARLHSECFTGDLLGSLKCDCGTQLQQALARMQQEGSGILLYLAQEGRGIGLINKLRAYALQDQGIDTVDANWRLGFESDERDFAPAAQMLRLLGYHAVRLLTNNPDKVAQLEAHGIEVVARVPHDFPANPHNMAYLATKRDRSGHLL